MPLDPITRSCRHVGLPYPCQHLGQVVEHRGSTCKNLRGCAVHGVCTIGGPVDIAWMRCAECGEYEPNHEHEATHAAASGS